MRTRTSDGYQQVELTAELTRRNGASQQVISVVPCRRHMPFFLCILIADLILFASVLLFAIYAHQYGGGIMPLYSSSLVANSTTTATTGANATDTTTLPATQAPPYQAFNVHALLMILAFIYLNGQAIIAYKSNYLIKHKTVNMMMHFVLHLITAGAVGGGLYYAYNAQHDIQQRRHGATAKVAHFYSAHSWTGLITIALFLAQFLFGFFTFLVTVCCRKASARLRARALPIHRMVAMIVLCSSVATVISGLTQLARFQMSGTTSTSSNSNNNNNNSIIFLDYRDFTLASILINVTAVCVIATTILIVLIIFLFKRRQANDLPIVFKSILGTTQVVQLLVVLAVVEFVFQVVTPHVNKVISGEIFANSTLSHMFNNATASLSSFTTSMISSASSTLSSATLTNLTNTLTGFSSSSPDAATSTTSTPNITLT